jgi:hypothetical protein
MCNYHKKQYHFLRYIWMLVIMMCWGFWHFKKQNDCLYCGFNVYFPFPLASCLPLSWCVLMKPSDLYIRHILAHWQHNKAIHFCSLDKMCCKKELISILIQYNFSILIRKVYDHGENLSHNIPVKCRQTSCMYGNTRQWYLPAESVY